MLPKLNKKIALFTFIIIFLFALTACNSKIKEDDSTIAALTSTEIEQTTQAAEPLILDDFELTTLDGSKVFLYDYEGETIVLNFWATWCTYCVQEMPLLDAMDKRDDIKVIAISVGEDAKTVRKYIEDAGYAFDVFLDEDGTLASKFGVSGFPTSFFLGPDFEFFYSFPGMLEEANFDSILAAIDQIKDGRVKP